MKATLILIPITFSIILLTDVTLATEKKFNSIEPTLIETYNEDITGDGLKEKINLWGILLSSDSDYYREVWTDITSHDSKQWNISYEGGYEPKLQFVDLTHDNINDIFYQSSAGGSGGLYNHHLHTISNQTFSEIALPKQPFVNGYFIDGLKAEILLYPNSEPIIVEINNNINDYIKLGIYNKEGNLLKDTKLIIEPIAFYEPTFISKSNGYGLRSYQQISGAFRADYLGVNETLWYLDKKDWIILQSEWVPEN